MKYSERTENGILFITFHGDLIGATDNLELFDFINEKINHGIYRAIINMGEVRYMNSSGIGILITIYTKFKNKSGDAVICNASDQIVKLLSMTKLDTVIRIFNDENEAKSKFNG